LFVLLVSGGAPLRASQRPLVFVETATINDMAASEKKKNPPLSPFFPR